MILEIKIIIPLIIMMSSMIIFIHRFIKINGKEDKDKYSLNLKILIISGIISAISCIITMNFGLSAFSLA